MGDIRINAAEEPINDYEKAKQDLLAFKASFDKLGKAEKERFVDEMIGVLMPGSSPIQTRMIKNFIKPFLVK